MKKMGEEQRASSPMEKMGEDHDLRTSGSLAQLQNSMGHMNDIVVADHLLERLSASREDMRISDHLSTAVGIVVGWHTHSASSSERRAEANWREFCRCDAFW
jgi:hypothetical protein